MGQKDEYRNIWDIQRSMSEGISFEKARGLCVM